RGLPERGRRRDQAVVAELVVAELDDVGAAAKRRVEERARVGRIGPRLAHEVEARLGHSLPSDPSDRLVAGLEELDRRDPIALEDPGLAAASGARCAAAGAAS